MAAQGPADNLPGPLPCLSNRTSEFRQVPKGNPPRRLGGVHVTTEEEMNQTMACTCGSVFEEGSAFCGNCGNPHTLSAPYAAPRPVSDKIPGPLLTASSPVVPQTGIPYEQARGDGRWRLRQPHERGAGMRQSSEPVGPAPFDADAVYLQKTLRHEPMELGLDDSVPLRTIGILVVRAWLASEIAFVPLALLGGVKADSGEGETLLVLALLVSTVVFWVVLLSSKVSEPIGEWRTLLDEGLAVLAKQLRLPQLEQESPLLLPQQPASPVVPPPSVRIPAPSPASPPAAWQTTVPPRTAVPREMPHE
jgi:hypothetical protein